MADAIQDKPLVWRKVLASEELPEGRVTSVTCDKRTLCMSHHAGQYGALDNKCPHHGRTAGRGLDRERSAALSLARLALRSDHR